MNKFMKRLILILTLLIGCFSCDRNIDSDVFVYQSPKAVYIDRATGGSAITMTRSGYETFPISIYAYQAGESQPQDMVDFWNYKVLLRAFPSEEKIKSIRSYEAYGCKITLSEDFSQYTVEVEKDCKWDYFHVRTSLVSGLGAYCPGFYIVLNPDLYDSLSQ